MDKLQKHIKNLPSLQEDGKIINGADNGWWYKKNIISLKDKPSEMLNRNNHMPKLCTGCNRIWQDEMTSDSMGYMKTYYHDDFPKYGLEKKECKECKTK